MENDHLVAKHVRVPDLPLSVQPSSSHMYTCTYSPRHLLASFIGLFFLECYRALLAEPHTFAQKIVITLPVWSLSIIYLTTLYHKNDLIMQFFLFFICSWLGTNQALQESKIVSLNCKFVVRDPGKRQNESRYGWNTDLCIAGILWPSLGSV